MSDLNRPMPPAYRSLWESHRLFQAIFDQTFQFIGLLAPDGTLLEANRTALEFGGFSRDTVVGQPMWDAPWWGGLPQVQQRLRDAVNLAAAGQFVRYETQILGSGGRSAFIDFSIKPARDDAGQIALLIFEGRDITERKRAEAEQFRLLQQMEAAEARFRQLVDAAPDATVISDHEGRIVLINKQAEQLLGYTRQELIGQPIEVLVPADVRAKHVHDRAHYQQDPRVRPMGAGLNLTAVRKDGAQVPVEISLSPLKSPDGLLVISAIRDITARKQAEARIVAYQQRLRNLASELTLTEQRERRKIAADLHDTLAQLLVVSKMRLAQLRDSNDSAQTAKTADQINEFLDEALRFTRTLMSELSPPMLYDLGLEPAIEWLAEKLRDKHGLDLRVEDDGQPKPLEEESRIALFQAVRELSMNIVKHAHAKLGKILIRRQNGYIEITVQDDGAGYDPAGANHRASDGGGFGLFNIRERLDSFGGKMEIRSQPGQGTAVVLLAPLASPGTAVLENDRNGPSSTTHTHLAGG